MGHHFILKICLIFGFSKENLGEIWILAKIRTFRPLLSPRPKLLNRDPTATELPTIWTTISPNLIFFRIYSPYLILDFWWLIDDIYSCWIRFYLFSFYRTSLSPKLRSFNFLFELFYEFFTDDLWLQTWCCSSLFYEE